MNNIRDCDLSDVVLNMEIGLNGSIILPLSPNPESIISNNIAQLDDDHPLTPRNKHSRRYSSDSSSVLQRENSLGDVTEDVSQPCCSKTLNFSSSRASSRQSNSDVALDIFNPVDSSNLKNTNGTLIVESTPSNKKPNFPTPFKTAFYFPKSPKKTTTRQTKKLTPTVAVADEFIEYQRRIEKEKKEKSDGILKRRAERLKKQEERNLQNLKMIQKRKNGKSNVQKPKSTLKNPTILEKIEEDQETEATIDDDNIQIPLQHRRNNLTYILNSESSNDDEDVTFTIRKKKASSVKKAYTELFGESTSGSST